LKSLNTCPERTGKFIRIVIATFAAMLTARSASALDPARDTSQYIHDRWEGDRGFPGGSVHRIVQSSDGYLWIGADKGLVRFDGLTFRLIPGNAPGGQNQSVLGIVTEPGGGLWAQLRTTDLVRYDSTRFIDMPQSLAAIGPAVTALTRGIDGALILATVDHGIVRYRAGRLDTIAPRRSLPSSFVIAIAQMPDGDLWLGTRDSGLLRLHNGELQRVKGLPDQKVNTLLAGDRQQLWIGTDNGISIWDGIAVGTTNLPPAVEHVAALSMFRDRDGNVWVGTTNGQLLRVNGQSVQAFEDGDRARRGAVTTIFEDRDSNLWFGTTRGLERLRDGVFTTIGAAQGLPAETSGPVYASADATWIAPSTGGLYVVRRGRATRISTAGLDGDLVYSIAGGNGEIWVGRQRGGLTQLRIEDDRFSAKTWGKSDGLAQDNVYAVYRSRDGTVWAGTLSAGLSRFRNGAFTTFTTADGLASNTVSAIVETADGTIWLATPNGLSAQSKGKWIRYSTEDGLPTNEINTLAEDSAGNVWIGTAAGLALVRDGRVVKAFRPPSLLRASILGIVEDRLGGLWVATPENILRVERVRLADHTAADNDVRDYAAPDGLPSVEGVKRHRSLTIDQRGRIWVAVSRGLAMTDPERTRGRIAPALMRVESVSADGRTIANGNPLRIPPRQQRIAFRFTGLSLATPERVQFQYRLDGFDRDWSAPSASREAVYTNLPPATYLFHLKGSNGDGIWNGPEATVQMQILPSYWQTTWFQISMLAVASLLIWVAYRLRMMQLSRSLNVRFEERLAERTRIAQELHDTLLQGFVSASMQLHVATDRLPPDSAARPAITKVMDLMGRVIDEGRNAVRGLRSPALEDDLHHAFAGIADEVGGDRPVDYRVVIDGHDRHLKPFIRDEIYRIGREAVVNALRHSHAARVELALDYSPKGLRVLVRDDGRGINTEILQSGKDGHWGLTGMRERAERIGGTLRVWSSDGEGTEVELLVPARVAFAPEKHRGRPA
jgi:signal transduction histidine kinase/ligand-binding sensor domain-containing protein